MDDIPKLNSSTSEKCRKIAKRLILILLNILFLVYVTGVLVSAPYFNWTYARQHGFWNWVLFGQLAPTMKSIVWPYHLLYPEKSHRRPSARSMNEFRFSMEALSQAESKLPKEGHVIELDARMIKEQLFYYEVALQHARKVDADELLYADPSAPRRFRSEFLRGLSLLCEGARTENVTLMNEGNRLIGEWGGMVQKHPRRKVERGAALSGLSGSRIEPDQEQRCKAL